MTTSQRNACILVVAALIVGWWLGSAGRNPPGPLDNRPVARWIARTAKQLLWIAVFVEPPPPAHEPQAVRSEIGSDGFVKVDHGRGW